MKKHLLTCLIFFSFFFTTQAQTKSIEFSAANPGMWPVFVKYEDNQPTFRKDIISFVNSNGETKNVNDVSLLHVEKDSKGGQHYRYQQKYHGIPVENACWIVHSLNGKVSGQNGKLVKDYLANLQTRPVVKEKNALNKALEYLHAEKYKWEMQSEEDFIKKEQNNPDATFYPQGKLVYYSGETDLVPASLRLAYKFDVYAHEPVSRKYVFIDALTGSVLGERELIRESNANGTATTAYSGSQTITTDYTGTLFRLREINRGTGNGTINTYNLMQGVTYGAATDFTDADNLWNNVNPAKDEYATDAHWGTEKTYDYFLQKHNRNSIDNLGFPLLSYVHYSSNYFNAFWDGTRMTYGDGNATDGYKPLTSLDVCGHEITHGVTEHTSNLVYSYESGAMNEGFSDIFGTAIEWFARQASADWLIGGDFYTIRSMSNPNAYAHPDTYLGTYWYTGGGDNGGVHYNSGVLNHWFYLLVNGGSGTNDHGASYSVSGIGMNDAAAIAYLLNTSYLVSTSNYADARLLGIQAAQYLFGSMSNQAVQTANAWTAVGLYGATCSDVTGLLSSGISETGAELSWDPTPGAYYYQIDYKAQSSSTWIHFSGTTATHVNLYGLASTTPYDWRVKSSCSSNYSVAQFTTSAPVCAIPTGLGATINGTTVNLEWNYSAYGMRFHVEYKPNTDIFWIDAGWVTVNYKTLTGLANSALYDWRIESECSFDTSGYAQAQFTTNAVACGTPTALSVSYLSGLRTILTWTEVPGATGYRVQIQWPGSGWTSPEIDETITNDSLEYVGFMSGMNLDWRVRAICPDNLSAYVASTLSTPCPAPTAVTASGITNSTAIISWTTSGANSIFGYDVYYKLTTATSWTYATSTSANTVLLTNLAAGKNYMCQVRQSCYNFNSSYASTSFTTLCSTSPTSLTSTEVKTNSAKITWATVPGALSYSLQYKTSAATSWTTLSGLTTNSYILTGLLTATTYYFKVNMTCSIGSSAYSVADTLKTYCASSGNNNNEWIDYIKLGTINRTSVNEVGGYIHTGISTSLVLGSTANAGQISAGFSGATKKQLYAIYIDFNRNGSYSDVGERVAGVATLTNASVFNFTISVPNTARPGLTGMRVVMLREVSGLTVGPCLTGNRGETEDYFINLVNPTAFSPGDPTVSKEENSTIIPVANFGVNVYPNPSDGKFTVEMDETFSACYYEVVNLTGDRIREEKVQFNNSIQLNISDEPAGIYLLRLIDTTGKLNTFKLIKR